MVQDVNKLAGLIALMWIVGMMIIAYLSVRTLNKTWTKTVKPVKTKSVMFFKKIIKPYMRLCSEHVISHSKNGMISYIDEQNCQICRKDK